MLDSEPFFRDRIKAIGVSDAFQLALIAAGITTFGSYYLFVCIYARLW